MLQNLKDTKKIPLTSIQIWKSKFLRKYTDILKIISDEIDILVNFITL